MSEQWDEAEAERRQAARMAAIGRCGPVPRRVKERKPPTEREQLLAAGLTYSVAEQDQAEAAAEDRRRRRQADAELGVKARLFKSLSDTLGPDKAEEWMNGGDAA